MHLENQLVLRVHERAHSVGVAARDPGPGSRPAVALGGDVLGVGACGADAVNGGLVERHDEGLVHVVVFVVGVEDDLAIVLVRSCYGRPEGLEASDIGDDFIIVAPVVVRGDHGKCAPFGDVVDSLISC